MTKETSNKTQGRKEGAKKRRGRHSTYNETIATKICTLVSEGLSVRKVCEMEGMPSRYTVYKWISQYDDFANRYARAKTLGSEALADEILEIADDGTNDWMEKHDKNGEHIGWQLNGEHVQRSRLRVDTRKWLLAKLQPTKYGERVDMNHGLQPDNPIMSLIQQVSGNTLRPDEGDEG